MTKIFRGLKVAAALPQRPLRPQRPQWPAISLRFFTRGDFFRLTSRRSYEHQHMVEFGAASFRRETFDRMPMARLDLLSEVGTPKSNNYTGIGQTLVFLVRTGAETNFWSRLTSETRP